ncbi:hypothetical protein MGM1_4710 [Candidatus Malacoplasma girerdii]|uniref:Lipoprotein n=1 Tax=Candidatus Malacoplasma girerdii TaxID=1318617 RepID=A0A097STD6_9BACT|nr:hypothetical protein MGM1_4710 [Candidatus Malacoplasma girerdii]
MKKNRLLWLPLALITITPILSSCSNKNTYEVLYSSLKSKYIEMNYQATPTYIKHEPDKSFETEKDLKQYLVANYKTNEELTNEVYRTFFLFFINTDWSKQRIYSSSTPNNEIKSIFALKDSKDVSISIRTAFAELEDLKLDEKTRDLNFTFLLYGIFNITFLKDVGTFKTGDILQYIVDVCDTDEIIAKANITTEKNEYKLYFTYQYTSGNENGIITQERWIKSHKISLWHDHDLKQWVKNYDANGVNGYIHWSFNKK